MKIFSFTFKQFELIGLFPLDCPRSFRLKLVHSLLIVTIISAAIISMVYSMFAAHKPSDSNSLEDSVTLSIFILHLCLYILLMCEKSRLFATIDDLEKFVTERMEHSAVMYIMYEETDFLNEKRTKMFHSYLKITVFSFCAFRLYSLGFTLITNGSIDSLPFLLPMTYDFLLLTINSSLYSTMIHFLFFKQT